MTTPENIPEYLEELADPEFGLGRAWSRADHPFEFCEVSELDYSVPCGCLTQVKQGCPAERESWADFIRADPLIPESIEALSAMPREERLKCLREMSRLQVIMRAGGEMGSETEED